MNDNMNNYDERIARIKQGLTQELDIRELTVMTNEGVGLYCMLKSRRICSLKQFPFCKEK